MINITFQGKDITLKGRQVQVNDTLPKFKVIMDNLDEVSSDELKGVRIYLSVPSLDTGVCSMEVSKFNSYMKELPSVACYSISMDLPFALSRWCQNNVSDNIKTAADYKYRSFGDATGTYINELGLLARACFVVDNNNVVQYVEYVNEVSKEPDYDALLVAVKKLIA